MHTTTARPTHHHDRRWIRRQHLNRRAKNKTDLVLGGGGARGIALVGLLFACEALFINIGMIIGVSIGAIVAVLYANGYSPKQILSIMLREMPKVSSGGMLAAVILPLKHGMDLEEFFAYMIATYDLKPQPNLRIVAFNLSKRQTVIFEGTNYNLLKALLASCAIPFLMRPVWFGQPGILGHLMGIWSGIFQQGEDVYVDGFLHHPNPGDLSPGKAIIGKLGWATSLPRHPVGLFELAFQSFEIVTSAVLDAIFPDPSGHVLIPLGDADVSVLSFAMSEDKAMEMVRNARQISMLKLKAAIKNGQVSVRVKRRNCQV